MGSAWRLWGSYQPKLQVQPAGLQYHGSPAMRRLDAPYGTSRTSVASPSRDASSGDGGGSSAALLLEAHAGTALALAWMTDGKREMLKGSRPGAPSCSKRRSSIAVLDEEAREARLEEAQRDAQDARGTQRVVQELAVGQFNATRQLLRDELQILNAEAETRREEEDAAARQHAEEAAAEKLREAEERAKAVLRQAEEAAQAMTKEAQSRAREAELLRKRLSTEARSLEDESVAVRRRLEEEAEKLRSSAQSEAEMTWKRAEAAMTALRKREALSASEAGQAALARARLHLRSTKLPDDAPLPPPSQLSSASEGCTESALMSETAWDTRVPPFSALDEGTPAHGQEQEPDNLRI